MNNKAQLPPIPFKLKFAPDQHPHCIGLVMVATVAEMCAILETLDGEHVLLPEAGGGPPMAVCCYNHDGPVEFGFVMFAEETLSVGVMVHELSHAALRFVSDKVMTSANVQAKSEQEQNDYFDEALAHTIEALTEQAFPILFPHFNA